MKQATEQAILRTAAGILVLLVLVATLRPGSLAPESWIHGCIVCGPYGVADIVRNLMLFAPLGLVLPRALGSTRRAVVAMVALTVFIECAQLVIPGRDSNPTDILFNSLGGVLGILLGQRLPQWLPPGPPPPVRRLTTYVGLLLVCAAGLGIASAPRFPEGGLIGQWTPIRDGFDPFTGLVHDVTIAGQTVPAWTVPRGRGSFQAFLDGEPIDLHFTRGALSTGPQLLVRLVMPGHRELLLIGLQGDGVIVRPRTAFTHLRVFEPIVRIPGVFASPEVGESVHMSVFRADDRYCVEIGDTADPVCGAAMTVGHSWMLGVGTDRWSARRLAQVAGLVLIVAALPLGWWGGLVGGLIAVVGLGLGVASLAALTALSVVAWEGWPVLLGTLLGAGLRGAWIRRRQRDENGTDLESVPSMSPSKN